MDDPKKPGPPVVAPSPKLVPLTIYVRAPDWDRIFRLAQDERCSMSRIARRAVAAGLRPYPNPRRP